MVGFIYLLYIDTQKPPGSSSAAGGFFYGGWSDRVMEELGVSGVGGAAAGAL